ncbi:MULTISPECIES: HNH/endonuclease VII fold putative polymorphic toxin [Streptomyces]|uniref:HNH/endonuclease VII fold putative polymorphic toxin n=1 Tax=Streptomyces TaxID=1883 RepID=UPI00345BE466
MSIKHKVQHFLVEYMGLYWPDGDADKLRKAAKAWRKFAGEVEKVRTPVNNQATSLIHNNKGEAIEAFEVFWHRYAKGSQDGWLHDLAKSSEKMADGLEKLAEAVDKAMDQLWEKIIEDLVVLGAAVTLALATGGALTPAAGAAATAIVEAGAALGVVVSTTVAEVAGVTLAAAAFGGLESVTVNLAVAQPIKIAQGRQDGINFTEAGNAANDGMIYGGLFGGFGSLAKNAGAAGGYRNLFKGVRPLDVELAQAARLPVNIDCALDPIDVATGAMLLPATDVTLPGSLPLVVERTHVSSYRAGAWFGPTWASTFDERVQLDGDGVVYAAADGMRLVYPVPVPGEPVLPVKGPRRPLTWDGRPGGVMTIADPQTGITRTFGGLVPTEEPGILQLPLESMEDRNGARIDVERTATGTPTAIRHSGGSYVAVETDVIGEAGARVTALRLLDEPPSPYEPPTAPGRGTTLIRYGYDDAGNLTEVTNSSGKPLRFTYDAEGRITSWTDRNGTSYGYTYDASGRVVRTEGSDGFLSGSLAYDPETRTTTVTDSLGNERTYRYNAAALVTEETDPLGHKTLTKWDERGADRLSVTDPLGRTTRYAYDEQGNLAKVVLPDGSSGEALYNDLCRPVEVTEPGGATWRHTYDDRGNLATTTDPAGAETRYAHDDRGRLVAVTDALGHASQVECDAAGLPVAITDALGHRTAVRRDVFGRIVEAVDPLGRVTRTTWTTEGRPSRREYPDGTSETWTWDGEGNLVTHTDTAGNITRHEAGHFDLPTSRTDPDGTTYAFTYDTELRLTGVTNPQGLVWSYAYDAAGRLTSETDFNGRTLAYAHDAAGGLAARTNGAGETLHFTRDALGRATEQRADDAEAVTTFAYDAAGNLVRAVNADAEVVYERDVLGRVLSESVNGRATSYAYDALGRRVRRVTPSGLASEWTYDAAGRPTELAGEAGGLTFTYDAAGRETERRLGGEGTVLTQQWDAADRLTTQVVRGAERLLQHREYAYREDGYLREIRELTSGTRRFDLDASGRVTTVRAHGWTERYAYDGAGNVTSATAPDHSAPGQREFEGTLIRRAGRTTYEHDAQGRLTRKTRKLLNGRTRVWTYTWDAEDRLREAVTPEGERWQYAYDPLGRRVSKRCEGRDGETLFAWDGTRLAEQTAADGRTTTWDYAPGTHRPLTQTDSTRLTRSAGKSLIEGFAEEAERDFGTRFHAVITDAVGTPTELITPTGELSWQHRTTLWGTPLLAPTAEGAPDCPLRFPGQYADVETGLHYNYFRYYDSEAHRYVTPDPLGLVPADNHHGYVVNPYGWGDPLGLAPEGCKIAQPSHDYSPSRNAAFRKAKRHLGIPMSQQPDELQMVPMTGRSGRQVMDDNGQAVMTREYVYTRNDGSRVIIQDHSAGHQFGEGGVGDQGRHLNVRPFENPRTGKVPGTAQHYEY